MTSFSQRNNFVIGIITIVLLFFSNAIFAQLSLWTNQENAYFEAGETATFYITSDSTGTIQYTLKYGNLSPVISTGSMSITAGDTLLVTHQETEPGVVLCRIQQGPHSVSAAAAFSPFEIECFAEEPADFDDFWNTQKNNSANLPLDSELTFYESGDFSTTYRINFANIQNRRVYGYLTVPNGPGPFPAFITFPPFSDIANNVLPEVTLAEKGNVLSLTISIHNAEPDEVDSLAYIPDIVNDRDSFYYKHSIIAGIRAIDYIFSRDDFDGSTLGVTGVSQGAGLAIMVAGIDNRVKFLLNSNPIMAQTLGTLSGREGGFPNYLNTAIVQPNSPAYEAQVEEAVKYYETIFFARRFQGISWSYISYRDVVTPAATSFGAFNALNGQKFLTHSLDLGHSHPIDYWDGRLNFLRRFIPASMNPPVPFSSTDQGYFIDAGNDFSIDINEVSTLNGTAAFHTMVNPNFELKWEKKYGPGDVYFSDAGVYNNVVTFSDTGDYVLQFLAVDYSNDLQGAQKYYTLVDEISITAIDTTPVGLLAQNIIFDSIPDQSTTSPPIILDATSSSNLPVVFEVISGPATINGNTLTLDGTPGTVIVKAKQIGNTDYAPAPSVFKIFQVIAAQEINFDNIPNKTTTDLPFSISANSTSGLLVSLEVVSGPATISGNVITLDGIIGIVTIKASQTGSNIYLPANDVYKIFEVELTNQTISFDNIPNKLTTDLPFSINANSTSNLPIAFEIISGPAIINGNVVALDGITGTVILKATQSGNSQYAEATDIFQNFEINLANQDITFDNISDKLTTDLPFSINAISTSGLPVSFEIVSGPATVSGNMVTLDGTFGIVNIKAIQNGNNQYNAAIEFIQSFEVTLVNQTISFDNIPSKITSDAPFIVNAISTSGLPVDFEITSGPASVGGNIVTLDGVIGAITIKAIQSGNNQFLPATSISQTFEVAGENQTINFPEIDNKLITDSPFIIVASSSAGLPVNFEIVSGPVSLNGNEITLDGIIGTVTIRAFQNGDSYFASATDVLRTFQVEELFMLTCEDPQNLAFKRPTFQSGTLEGATSYRAVDGITIGDFYEKNSVSQTESKLEAWWEVDLGSISEIDKIQIWNRTDCCAEELIDFYVLVSNEPLISRKLNTALVQNGVSSFYIADQAGTPTKFEIGRTGRYIRVQLKGEGRVMLAELEVIGCVGEELIKVSDQIRSSDVFPNPTTDLVNVRTDIFIGKNLELEVFNPLGVLVLEKKIEEVAENLVEFSISNLASGTYFLKTKSEGLEDKTLPIIIIQN